MASGALLCGVNTQRREFILLGIFDVTYAKAVTDRMAPVFSVEPYTTTVKFIILHLKKIF